MAKPGQLRWGLLGTARINQAIIAPIRTSKSSALVAVASRSPEKAIEYAKTWEIPRYFTSYDGLLEDPDIDVIYNSLPNSLHAEWSVKAMLLGKHVLCEKPIATNTAEMDRIIAVAQQTGRVITEAFMYRHHPQTLLVKKQIDEGEIGSLLMVHGSFCFTITRPSDIRLDPSLGGGSLWDVGCYPVSYARYVIGKEPVEIFGWQITGNTGVDLLFAGQMLFPGGVIAQFDCSFTSPSKHGMHFTGDKGMITVPMPFKPGMREEILVDRNGKRQIIRVKGMRLYSGEVNDIEAAILDGKSPQINLQDSRANVLSIETFYKSATISKPITLSI